MQVMVTVKVAVPCSGTSVNLALFDVEDVRVPSQNLYQNISKMTVSYR